MMTLRLEKPSPSRTEFYEGELFVSSPPNENGVITIARHEPSGGVCEHHVGPLRGQAKEAFLMNAHGKTIEIIRAPYMDESH